MNDELGLFRRECKNIEAPGLSNKVEILCQILDAARDAGDKVLVFSQSIPTLNFLEKVLKAQGRKTARLDGKTQMGSRQSMAKSFNTNATELYLISTTAGGLGLNLPGANRVVIMDFKFSPIPEEQAVGRAYRIGQKKPTFVYRLISGGTFEEVIHNKTIFKTQLASQVVDKKSIKPNATKKMSDFLFEPKTVKQADLAEFRGMDTQVLDKILFSPKSTNIVRAIIQSDTFSRNDEDVLTVEEQKEVKDMLDDEQLKRSNPQAYAAKQLADAERARLSRVHTLQQAQMQQARSQQANLARAHASVPYRAQPHSVPNGMPRNGPTIHRLPLSSEVNDNLPITNNPPRPSGGRGSPETRIVPGSQPNSSAIISNDGLPRDLGSLRPSQSVQSPTQSPSVIIRQPGDPILPPDKSRDDLTMPRGRSPILGAATRVDSISQEPTMPPAKSPSPEYRPKNAMRPGRKNTQRPTEDITNVRESNHSLGSPSNDLNVPGTVRHRALPNGALAFSDATSEQKHHDCSSHLATSPLSGHIKGSSLPPSWLNDPITPTFLSDFNSSGIAASSDVGSVSSTPTAKSRSQNLPQMQPGTPVKSVWKHVRDITGL